MRIYAKIGNINITEREISYFYFYYFYFYFETESNYVLLTDLELTTYTKLALNLPSSASF